MAQLTKSLLKNKFINIIKDFFKKSNMKDVAEEGAKLIRERTRDGFGVSKDGGEERKLKALKPSTIEKRKRKSLSSQTSPSKSNLTETGDMLDSIKGTVDAANKPKIEISGADNRRKADEVQKDRPFMNLSKKEIDALEDDLKKKLIKSIQRGL